jgi:hypothetical protein
VFTLDMPGLRPSLAPGEEVRGLDGKRPKGDEGRWVNRAILGTSLGGGKENGGNEPAAERRDEKLDEISIVLASNANGLSVVVFG